MELFTEGVSDTGIYELDSLKQHIDDYKSSLTSHTLLSDQLLLCQT